MNKKTLIFCISILAVLVAVVVAGVVALYSGQGSKKEIPDGKSFFRASSAMPILNVVPTDAAMVLHCGAFRNELEVLTDSTSLLGPLFSGTQRNSFDSFVSLAAKALADGKLNPLKNSESTISIHYAGDLVPLLLVESGVTTADSTNCVGLLMSFADSAGLSCKLIEPSSEYPATFRKKAVLAFSPAESLVKSAYRHIGSGSSVLDDEDCSNVVNGLGGGTSLLLNTSYSGQLAASLCARGFRKHASFLKNYTGWVGLDIARDGDNTLTLNGVMSSPDSPSFYSKVHSGIEPSESGMYGILPAQTIFAASLTFNDVDSYLKAYRKYLDAAGTLSKYNASINAISKEQGVSPEAWLKALNINEVCSSLLAIDGNVEHVLLLKAGKENCSELFRNQGIKSLKNYDGSVLASGLFASIPTVFGGIFSQADSTYIYKDGWLINGSSAALALFREEYTTVAAHLTELGAQDVLPGDGTVFQTYYMPKLASETLSDVFCKNLASKASKVLEGTLAVPVTFSVRNAGSRLTLNAVRKRVVFRAGKENVGMAVNDTVVNIPSGPFKVKNCGTGKTNLFSQNSNNYLVLTDENGKGLWGVPFQGKLCGAVAEIDYFANGKIQFLFASGSKLYLIDRLGRFVNPFPVELGKEVLLGPAAYDFTGAHGYTVLVLHKDNTVSMYDIHGRKPASWKDITAKETIKSLPELLVVKGKRYWIVRTSVRTLIFGADGGAPVYDADGNKMLRPDTEVKVNDNGTISALCHDGKERAIKI